MLTSGGRRRGGRRRRRRRPRAAASGRARGGPARAPGRRGTSRRPAGRRSRKRGPGAVRPSRRTTPVVSAARCSCPAATMPRARRSPRRARARTPGASAAMRGDRVGAAGVGAGGTRPLRAQPQPLAAEPERRALVAEQRTEPAGPRQASAAVAAEHDRAGAGQDEHAGPATERAEERDLGVGDHLDVVGESAQAATKRCALGGGPHAARRDDQRVDPAPPRSRLGKTLARSGTRLTRFTRARGASIAKDDGADPRTAEIDADGERTNAAVEPQTWLTVPLIMRRGRRRARAAGNRRQTTGHRGTGDAAVPAASGGGYHGQGLHGVAAGRKCDRGTGHEPARGGAGRGRPCRPRHPAHRRRILRSPRQPSRLALEQRRLEVRRIAADLFDFDEISRRALSRHWTARTAEEQAEFVRLFTDLLERTYLGRIESYAGEKIVYLGETVDGSFATVRSKVVTRRRARDPARLPAAPARRPLEGLRRPHRPRELRGDLPQRVRPDHAAGTLRRARRAPAQAERSPPSALVRSR